MPAQFSGNTVDYGDGTYGDAISPRRSDGSLMDTSSATRVAAITPSDDDDGIHDVSDAVILDGGGNPLVARALATRLDASGTIHVTTLGGDDVILPGEFFKRGVPFPISVTRVWGTDTTATQDGNTIYLLA